MSYEELEQQYMKAKSEYEKKRHGDFEKQLKEAQYQAQMIYWKYKVKQLQKISDEIKEAEREIKVYEITCIVVISVIVLMFVFLVFKVFIN